ncbi:MAG TPA: TetR/AcrR family transcriptional regulator, partial [Bradyrhizobium sp.]|nr:TetR/AcrR family transcriptional regulator [Bradyrhizobium sp.]
VKPMVSKRNDLKRPRLGRPPKDLAGDVKARILDAAQRVFLKRGYQSASLDEIAETAPASKPTIYAHFPGKEALFEAVVARVIEGLTDFEGFAPKGRSVQDRLASLGIEVVERFIDETIGITRATIAEADRFPALSRQVHEHGRDRAAAAVSHVLNDATTALSRGSKGPFGPKRSVSTAQIFMDLILLPMIMRALMGEGVKELRSELPAFVRERVSFFLAACEADWGK